MRWSGWLVAISLSFVATGCRGQSPTTPLARVSESQAVRVRFAPRPRTMLYGTPRPLPDTLRLIDQGNAAFADFHELLSGTLVRAGYHVTDDGTPDVYLVTHLLGRTEMREARHGEFSASMSDIVRLEIIAYDPRGVPIDRFDFTFVDTPENLATDVVNAMVRSPKMATYAEACKRGTLAHAASPIPIEDDVRR